VQGFFRDKSGLQASALTFYSLLSVVPVVALAFGLAKGFGLEQGLEKQLYQRSAGQEAAVEKIIDFSRSLLANTQGGLIAGIGVILLFWSAIKVLGNIEEALNDIWKVRARSWLRKFTDYLAIMMISPFLVIISSSLTVYITTQVTEITRQLALLELAGPLIFAMLRLLPFGLVWLLFFLIYMVMPNTHVRFASALVAGIIAGTMFQIVQGTYIHLQVLLSKYNAIYGSFAALPFFLIWLNLSWMIVLFGAQIAYAHQHVSRHTEDIDYQEISIHARKQVALYILRHLFRQFGQGRPPLSAERIAEMCDLPSALVEQIVAQLVRCGMLSPVCSDPNEERLYLPAHDIHTITVLDVWEAWDKLGRNDPPAGVDQKYFDLLDSLEAIDKEMREIPSNRLVIDL